LRHKKKFSEALDTDLARYPANPKAGYPAGFMAKNANVFKNKTFKET
jgi:hypothetical protein